MRLCKKYSKKVLKTNKICAIMCSTMMRYSSRFLQRPGWG